MLILSLLLFLLSLCFPLEFYLTLLFVYGFSQKSLILFQLFISLRLATDKVILRFLLITYDTHWSLFSMISFQMPSHSVHFSSCHAVLLPYFHFRLLSICPLIVTTFSSLYLRNQLNLKALRHFVRFAHTCI